MSSKNKKPNSTDFWDRRRGTIYSTKGGAILWKGEVFSHGYSLLDELAVDYSYFQVLALNITGRMPERRFADWMEAAFICMSWPEPRIWCNQIGALAGSLRTSPVAAAAAGVLAADSTMYGSLPLLESGRFIQEALKKKNRGISVEDLIKEHVSLFKGKPHLVGYSRPISRGDERVAVLEGVTEKLGFDIGEHLSLSYEISDWLYTNYNESMNINSYVAAFSSDHGYTADEMYQIAAMSVSAGVMACYIDTNIQPSESFLPLRCEDIKYIGKHPRPVPERE